MTTGLVCEDLSEAIKQEMNEPRMARITRIGFSEFASDSAPHGDRHSSAPTHHRGDLEVTTTGIHADQPVVVTSTSPPRRVEIHLRKFAGIRAHLRSQKGSTQMAADLRGLT